ncbi:MAG: HAMP domain-containing sensor histidine kinase [Bryobacteraceae bacterium]
MTHTGELPVSSDLERRTAWFIKLRWLAAGGVVGGAGIARILGLSDLPVGPILAVGTGLFVYNTVLYFVAARLSVKPAERTWGSANSFARLLVPRTFLGLGDESGVARAAFFAFVQITLDFLFLAVLVHLSGGVGSPFSVFFVFHVVIASILLSRRATYLQTTVGFLLFASVVLGEYFGLLDHHPLHSVWPADAYRSFGVAATGLVVLGATLYLASYLCSTIAVDLRERVRTNVRLSRQIADENRKLEAAYETLRESERTKSQYMRKVAHELRGPLGTIETALKVLLQGMAGPLDGPSRDLIGRAQRRAGELAAVTHDLLLLARAREAGLDEERVPVALDGLLAEAIEDFRQSAQSKNVALSADTCCGTVVLADPVAIRQLVANLVENGIRYTKPGGSVSARLRSRGGCVVLEVEDTGIGIAEGDLPRVFDEFYRGANAREYAAEGTGLGLAICKVIAERHGGNIAVESRPGHGTCFAVTLPGTS